MGYEEYLRKRIRTAKIFGAIYFAAGGLFIFVGIIPETSDNFMLIFLSFAAIFLFLGFSYLRYSTRIAIQPARVTDREIVLPYPMSLVSNKREIPFENISEAIVLRNRNAVFLRTTETNILIDYEVVEDGIDLPAILEERGVNVRRN